MGKFTKLVEAINPNAIAAITPGGSMFISTSELESKAAIWCAKGSTSGIKCIEVNTKDFKIFPGEYGNNYALPIDNLWCSISEAHFKNISKLAVDDLIEFFIVPDVDKNGKKYMGFLASGMEEPGKGHYVHRGRYVKL